METEMEIIGTCRVFPRRPDLFPYSWSRSKNTPKNITFLLLILLNYSFNDAPLTRICIKDPRWFPKPGTSRGFTSDATSHKYNIRREYRFGHTIACRRWFMMGWDFIACLVIISCISVACFSAGCMGATRSNPNDTGPGSNTTIPGMSGTGNQSRYQNLALGEPAVLHKGNMTLSFTVHDKSRDPVRKSVLFELSVTNTGNAPVAEL